MDESISDEDGNEVWPVYESVFGDYADHPTGARILSTTGPELRSRLVLAYDAGEAVGLASVTCGRGQWWTDHASLALGPQVAEAWLGGRFELVSIGVVEAVRGKGIGRGLLAAVVHGLAHERLLLMTSLDSADPARRLYASEGWQVLGPGIGEATVIMARRNLDQPTNDPGARLEA